MDFFVCRGLEDFERSKGLVSNFFKKKKLSINDAHTTANFYSNQFCNSHDAKLISF